MKETDQQLITLDRLPFYNVILEMEGLTVENILENNSSFRNECNVFHHHLYPFEQYHRYQRAVEELDMLKVQHTIITRTRNTRGMEVLIQEMSFSRWKQIQSFLLVVKQFNCWKTQLNS